MRRRGERAINSPPIRGWQGRGRRMEAFRVTYRLRVDAGSAPERARELAYEQTVEVPPSVVREPFIAEQIVGKVERIGKPSLIMTIVTS